MAFAFTIIRSEGDHNVLQKVNIKQDNLNFITVLFLFVKFDTKTEEITKLALIKKNKIMI
jgi:hypothetical protein